MRICFHHNDNDGRVAGMLVKHKFPDCRLVEVNYGPPFPAEEIQPNDEVYIVDFNPKPPEMDEILKHSKNVTFIDHHKTTPTAYEGYAWPEEATVIIDTSDAGCVLTWKHLFPDEVVPYWIQLVGDRDTWTFAKTGSKEFHAGSLIHDTRAESEFWQNLLSGDMIWESVASKGKAILSYRENWYRDYAFAWGFSTIFEGYKCFAVGLGTPGSEAFGPLIDEYDICLAFVWKAGQWSVSLYSKTVDVGEIAHKYGGGGHKGAAGFPCRFLPFESPQKLNFAECAKMLSGIIFDCVSSVTKPGQDDAELLVYHKGLIMGRAAKWLKDNGLTISEAATDGKWKEIWEGLYHEAPILPDVQDIDTT